jgi:Tfp pilus assembly protein PilF
MMDPVPPFPRWVRLGILAATALLAALPAPVAAQGESPDAIVQEAFDLSYNLDHDPAIAKLTEAAKRYPQHIGIQRALATMTWLHLLFTRGQVLVDDYLGPVSRQNVKADPAPTEVSQAFHTYLARALTLANERVTKSPQDAEAHYELGTALGLQASWTATVDGRVMGAFGSARRAYNEHERVLALSPNRKDAGLIVGTYRYLVGSLSMPVRWMAYVAGFGGDKERGLRMIEEAATVPSTRTDARFALVLLYNRELQWDLAMKHLRALQASHPRNRLVWLEAGSTLLRAGRFAEADAMLTEGINKFGSDTRRRMLGEPGLWYYKRGTARVRLKKLAEARADLRQGLTLEARQWVKARMHLELGKAADLAGDRGGARAAYDDAIRIATAAQDTAALEEANRLKGAGYKG